MGKADNVSTTRHNRTICLPFSQDVYHTKIKNPVDFRLCIDEFIELFPELFLPQIADGYLMKDIYYSKVMITTVRSIIIRCLTNVGMYGYNLISEKWLIL